MKNKQQFNRLTLKEIEEEISMRKKLIFQMVGTLYPAILKNEIFELEEIFQNRLSENHQSELAF